jgi:hypothetical protein
VCLDFLIPLGEKHLRRILRDYVRHYNEGRPQFKPRSWHTRRRDGSSDQERSFHRARFYRSKQEVLGGLRNENWLEKALHKCLCGTALFCAPQPGAESHKDLPSCYVLDNLDID